MGLLPVLPLSQNPLPHILMHFQISSWWKGGPLPRLLFVPPCRRGTNCFISELLPGGVFHPLLLFAHPCQRLTGERAPIDCPAMGLGRVESVNVFYMRCCHFCSNMFRLLSRASHGSSADVCRRAVVDFASSNVRGSLGSWVSPGGFWGVLGVPSGPLGRGIGLSFYL